MVSDIKVHGIIPTLTEAFCHQVSVSEVWWPTHLSGSKLSYFLVNQEVCRLSQNVRMKAYLSLLTTYTYIVKY